MLGYILFASLIPFILWIIQKITNNTGRKANYIRRRVFAYCLCYGFLAHLASLFLPFYGFTIGIFLVLLMWGITFFYGLMDKDLGENRGFLYSIWEAYKPEYVNFDNKDNEYICDEDEKYIQRKDKKSSAIKNNIPKNTSSNYEDIRREATTRKNTLQLGLICSNCGSSYKKGEKFCGECGNKLKDEQSSQSDWKNKLSKDQRKFLKQYGSSYGETYTEFLKRYSGQKFLDSSSKVQEKIIDSKYKIDENINNLIQGTKKVLNQISEPEAIRNSRREDWIHQLTDDQKNYLEKEGSDTNETLADFLQRYFNSKILKTTNKANELETQAVKDKQLSIKEKLAELKDLYDNDLVNEEEYAALKKKLLGL